MNSANGIPHALPVSAPRGALEGADHGQSVDEGLGGRGLKGVDEIDDDLGAPLADGHVKGDEHLEAGGLGSGVGKVQLLVGPAIAGADVEGEAVDAHGLGVVDFLGPVLGGLAVGETEHVVSENLSSHCDLFEFLLVVKYVKRKGQKRLVCSSNEGQK